MEKIYLASQSPRRKELMHWITDDFEIVPSDFDEQRIPLSSPEQYVLTLAQGKAEHAVIPDSDAVIIGCDTIVVSPEGKIFGKPKDRAQAAEMLRALSGKTHRVITGVCLLYKRASKQAETFFVTSLVTFYPLSESDISAYLDTEEYRDKAGAYGIQGKGGLLCQKIEGSYWNIVGFPAAEINRKLKQLIDI